KAKTHAGAKTHGTDRAELERSIGPLLCQTDRRTGVGGRGYCGPTSITQVMQAHRAHGAKLAWPRSERSSAKDLAYKQVLSFAESTKATERGRAPVPAMVSAIRAYLIKSRCEPNVHAQGLQRYLKGGVEIEDPEFPHSSHRPKDMQAVTV